jgi:hypothetical protein
MAEKFFEDFPSEKYLNNNWPPNEFEQIWGRDGKNEQGNIYKISNVQ